MREILRGIYSIWCVWWLLFFFLALFPFYWIFLQNKKTYPQAHFINRIWAFLTFSFCFIRWKNIYLAPLPSGPVVYCANHQSYVDIPLLFLGIPGYFSIVGKAALTKVPLFGYMFKRLYISVNRQSVRSRLKTYEDSYKVLNEGRSIAFFPEGTIPKDVAPNMIEFKDGPFVIAIEKQIPIVPVSLPFNWIILPDNGSYKATCHRSVAIYHPAIETKGMTQDDMESLKQKTFEIILSSIHKYNSNDH